MAESGRPVAESGRPASELSHRGGVGIARADDSPVGTIFPLSKSSVDMAASPLRQDELRKSSSVAACSQTVADSGSQPRPMGVHQEERDVSHQSKPNMPEMADSRDRMEGDHRSGPKTVAIDYQGRKDGSRHSVPITPEVPMPHHSAELPRSVTETAVSHWTGSPTPGQASVNSHPSMGDGGAPVSMGTSSSHRSLCDERQELAQQPVPRSLSASLHAAREGPPPRRSQTSAPCPGPGYCGQDAPGYPRLVCKQPMQLQQSNTVTTSHSSGSSPPDTSGHGEAKQPACGGEPCKGPLLNHGGLEDTFAAYCHPLPIPAPAQLLPQLAGAKGEGGDQRVPSHAALLAFPRLMSSVSETGLDAKRMMRCCGPDCQEQGAAYPIPPQGGVQQGAAYLIPPQRGIRQGEAKPTKETGTMTYCRELRDVGVQTASPAVPPPHVFPEVSLVAEDRDEGVDGPNGEATDQKPPIKEVRWDAEGMTWEVYGASVDPEELGLAIQKHLELQIKEKAGRAAKLSRQDTVTSQQSGRRRKRGGVIGSLRNPTCCARSSTVVD